MNLTGERPYNVKNPGSTDSCDGGEDLYNGAVEAATTLLGAASVFALGFIK